MTNFVSIFHYTQLLSTLPMTSLKHKTVLITGASAGIGKACAEAFAAEGSRLILCARRVDKLNAVSSEISVKYGIEVQTAQLDVSDSKAVHEFVHGLAPKWRDIDILVNNAGKSAWAWSIL